MKHALHTALFSIQAIIFSKPGVQLVGTTVVVVHILQALLSLVVEHNFMPLLVELANHQSEKCALLKVAVGVEEMEAFHFPQIFTQEQVVEVRSQFTTKLIPSMVESWYRAVVGAFKARILWVVENLLVKELQDMQEA